MTAKSRARKFNKKRSTKDDDPYALRLRKASEAAKRKAAERKAREAHPAGKGLKGQAPSYVVIDEARLVGVSLVEEGVSGYILEVGREEVRQEATSDTATLGEREVARVPGQSPSASASEPASEQEEVGHKVFFEKEVNLIPMHVGTEACVCDIARDHWVNLGEN